MKSWIIASLVLSVLSMVPGVSGYVIIDDWVIEDNQHVTLSANPHTINHTDEVVEFCLTSKTYDGPVDVVWGFDTDVLRPVNAWYNGNSLKDRISSVTHEYQGLDRWYYIKDINVSTSVTYCVKSLLRTGSPGKGKYWFCVKPSAETMQESISRNHFYCLDPWYDISWLYKASINISNSTTITPPFYMNITIDNDNKPAGFDFDNECFNYSHTRTMFTDSSETEILDALVVRCNSSSNYTTFFVNVTEDIPGNGVTIWMYYSNPSAAPGNDLDAVPLFAGSESYGDFSRWGISGTGGTISRTQDIVFDGNYSFNYSLLSNSVYNAYIQVTDPNYDRIDFSIYAEDDCTNHNVYQQICREPGGCDGYAYRFIDTLPFYNNDFACYSFTDTGYYYNDTGCSAWYQISMRNIQEGTKQNYDLYINDVFQHDYCESNGSINDGYWNFSSSNSRSPRYTYLDSILFYRHSDPWPSYTVGNQTVPSVADVNITSPANTSYYGTGSIPLTWEYIDNGQAPCDDAWYSLDGGVNVTIGCVNTSFSPLSFGPHYIALWANDTTGNISSPSTVHFTTSYGDFSFCIYNEMDEGSLINGTSNMLQVFCEEKTINYTMNDYCLDTIDVDCTINEIKLTSTFGGVNVWRTLIPVSSSENISFYMVNSSEHTVNVLNLFIQDLTSEFIGGTVHVTKVMSNGSVRIIDQILDAEMKAIIHWVEGEKYHITIEATDGTIRDLGDIVADTSTEKTIIVSQIALVPTRTLNGLGWLFGGDIGNINLTFVDSRGITVRIDFYVYNASNSSAPVIHSDSSTAESVVFNYTTPNNNTRYKACFEALTTHGYTYRACMYYTERTWVISYFEDNPVLYAIFGSLVALAIIAVSTQINIKYGLIGSSVWMLFVNTRGWFDSLTIEPALLYAVFTFALTVSIIYAIIEGEGGK